MGLSLQRLLAKIGLRVTRLRDFREQRLRQHVLMHAWTGPTPAFDFALPSFTPDEEDLALAERIIESFHAAKHAEAELLPDLVPQDDLWADIGSESHAEFLEFLRDREVRNVAGVLANALHHPVSRGLCWDDAQQLTSELARTPEGARRVGLTIADRFFALAEAVGVNGMELAEYGMFGECSVAKLAEVYDAVQAACGATLAIPDCFGLFGIRAGDHVIHTMTPSHAYTSWRIDQLLGDTTGKDICEIGGGYGGCAYFTFQRKPARYTIIDLPIINALQGYFLAKTCGADQVRLFGETPGDQPLHVRPYWEISNVPGHSVDLVVNQESLTEIDRANAQNYVTEIARISRGLFLSINHESGARAGSQGFEHNLVSRLVHDHGGFHRRYRFPTWIRRGHVEELFELVAKPADQRISSRTSVSASSSTG